MNKKYYIGAEIDNMFISSWDRQDRKTKIANYIKFIIGFTLVPTTVTTFFLMRYFDPIASYLIACAFWGSVLYKLNKK